MESQTVTELRNSEYFCLNKDRLRPQIPCEICGKHFIKTYWEKHKRDAHANTRKKIRCQWGADVYDIKKIIWLIAYTSKIIFLGIHRWAMNNCDC